MSYIIVVVTEAHNFRGQIPSSFAYLSIAADLLTWSAQISKVLCQDTVTEIPEIFAKLLIQLFSCAFSLTSGQHLVDAVLPDELVGFDLQHLKLLFLRKLAVEGIKLRQVMFEISSYRSFLHRSSGNTDSYR
jgi:hypothetical protein